MGIIDRRKDLKNKSAENRQKFLDRYKDTIKDKVDDIGDAVDIKDLKSKKKFKIKMKGIKEPKFNKDPSTGDKQIVIPGNDRYNVGDSIPKPQGGQGKGKGAGGDGTENGEDDFSFTLTKEEFLSIYFRNMSLPNFIKERIHKSKHYKIERAGYVTEGTPCKLDIKKSFEQAIARRIAMKKSPSEDLSEEDEVRKSYRGPYLDDMDLRYKFYKKVPKPIRHAVIFFVMDISGSMGQREKFIGRKFFLLLYLFLEQQYESVDIRFIAHTTEAWETTEEEFFYSRENGGTKVVTAYELVDKIIDSEYNISESNIYMAQVSDGDDWNPNESAGALKKLLTKLQYCVYLEIESSWAQFRGAGLYEYLVDLESDNFICAQVTDETDVLPALQSIFREKKK